MRRRVVAAVAVPLSLALLGLAGCGSEEQPKGIPTVTGAVGEEPEVSFPSTKPPSEQKAEVVSEGEGDLIRSDDLVVANIVDYRWISGDKTERVQSTYDTGTPMVLQMAKLPEDIKGTMVDQPVGSRVVYVFPPADSSQQAPGQPEPQPGATVSVIDIKQRFGEGDVVDAEQTSNGGGDLPTVSDEGHQMPTIEIPDSDAPDELKVEVLAEGDGPKVEKGQQLVAQYTGVQWKKGKTYDSPQQTFDATWRPDRNDGKPAVFSVGSGQLIEGWDKGLVGQKAGSRVMLSIPADMAYGEDPQGSQPGGPLVFVIDILGAFDPPPAPEQPSASPSASPSKSAEE